MLLLEMLSTIALLITVTAATAVVEKNDTESSLLAEKNDGLLQEYFQESNTKAQSFSESFGVTTLKNKNENIVRKTRNVIPDPQRRWPSAEVPYVIDESLERYRRLIMAAMNDYNDKTCVKFLPRTTERDYIWIYSGQGCYSNVGRIGGRQSVSLGQGCLFKGTIVHVLGHCVGFYNEQNRSDRDMYLTIYWNNIIKGMESEFALLKEHQNQLLVPFDTKSIMLDGSLHLSKTGRTKTMALKEDEDRILPETYEKPGLSDTDVLAISKMYNC